MKFPEGCTPWPLSAVVLFVPHQDPVAITSHTCLSLGDNPLLVFTALKCMNFWTVLGAERGGEF